MCFIDKDDNETPVGPRILNTTNVAGLLQDVLSVGFYVHFFGIIADGCFAIRIYYKGRNEWFNYLAIVLEVFYTLCYLVWLIWIQVIRFRKSGRICSGAYLDDEEVRDMYAIRQGKVILWLIIGVYIANVFITICAAIAGIIASKAIKDHNYQSKVKS